MAFIAVKDDYTIYTLPPYTYISVEVLNPIYNCLVVCPAVRGRFNNPKKREVSIGVLGDKVVFALYDQERRQCKAIATYIFNCCRPFLIIKLKLFTSSTTINIYNNYIVIDNTYYKACFVEIIEVCILDRVLCVYVGY